MRTQETPPQARPLDDPVAGLTSDALSASIIDLTRRLATGTHELLVLVGELDARGTWAAWGALSCAAWLAQACDIELSTARSQVRVARAMRDHPLLADAMRSGDVSYAKARTLIPHLTTDTAAELVELASATPARSLGAALARWSHRHEDPDTIDRRHHAERSVTWRTDPDGMITLTARLPPATGGQICRAIDTLVMRTPITPTGAPTAAPSRPAPETTSPPVQRTGPPPPAPTGASTAPPTSPTRATLAQQRADALHRLTTDGGAAITTEIVIHVEPDGNRLADGTPLTDNTVTAALPDAFVSLLVRDMAGHPIDASPRRRTPTRRQQRVLTERQPTCAHPGCTATTFLQADHIHPHADGGPTILDNLQTLCGPHNRARATARSAPSRREGR